MKAVILLETIKHCGKFVSPNTELELEDSFADSLIGAGVAKSIVAVDGNESDNAINPPPSNSDNEQNEEDADFENEIGKGNEQNESSDAMRESAIEELKEVQGVTTEIANLLFNNSVSCIADLQTKKIAELKKLGIEESIAKTIFNDAKNFQ